MLIQQVFTQMQGAQQGAEKVHFCSPLLWCQRTEHLSFVGLSVWWRWGPPGCLLGKGCAAPTQPSSQGCSSWLLNLCFSSKALFFPLFASSSYLPLPHTASFTWAEDPSDLFSPKNMTETQASSAHPGSHSVPAAFLCSRSCPLCLCSSPRADTTLSGRGQHFLVVGSFQRSLGGRKRGCAWPA